MSENCDLVGSGGTCSDHSAIASRAATNGTGKMNALMVLHNRTDSISITCI